jgi:hypothetical protein
VNSTRWICWLFGGIRQIFDITKLGIYKKRKEPMAQTRVRFLKWVHCQGSPALNGNCRTWAEAFLQKCCYKWRLKKCLGLDVVDLNISISKKWRKIHLNPYFLGFFIFWKQIRRAEKFRQQTKHLAQPGFSSFPSDYKILSARTRCLGCNIVPSLILHTGFERPWDSCSGLFLL